MSGIAVLRPVATVPGPQAIAVMELGLHPF